MIYTSNITQSAADKRIKDTLFDYCEYITSELKYIERIYLYGSQARGDWNEDSDIDLFAVIDQEIAPVKSIREVRREIIHSNNLFYCSYGKSYAISMKPFFRRGNVFSFEAYDGAYFQCVEREGILIYEKQKD